MQWIVERREEPLLEEQHLLELQGYAAGNEQGEPARIPVPHLEESTPGTYPVRLGSVADIADDYRAKLEADKALLLHRVALVSDYLQDMDQLQTVVGERLWFKARFNVDADLTRLRIEASKMNSKPLTT